MGVAGTHAGAAAELAARRRRSHLVVATPKDDPNRAVGFGYGAFLPGYGGYVCYMGVEPAARGRGAGTLLFRFLFRLIDSAARISAVPLPFVIWESHRPADPGLWAARLRVFDKVGGLWMRGAELLTPNYMRDGAPPVRLQLFVRPGQSSPRRSSPAACGPRWRGCTTRCIASVRTTRSAVIRSTIW